MSESDELFPTIMFCLGAIVLAALAYKIALDNCTASGGYLKWSVTNPMSNGMCLYPDGRVVE